MVKGIIAEVAVTGAIEVVKSIMAGIKINREKEAELRHSLKTLQSGYQQLRDENKALRNENEELRALLQQ